MEKLGVVIRTMVLGVLLLAATACKAAPPEKTTMLAERWQVTLTDGSQVVGKPAALSLTLKTPYLKTEIALDQVAAITVRTDREKTVIEMRNGDRLTGFVEAKPMKIVTLFGEVTTPFEKVSGLRMLPDEKTAAAAAQLPGPPTPLDAYVIHGQVDGQRTDFVENVPEELARRYARVTRSASTGGSVASRHTTAPWLYPVANIDEVPQVFVEGGKKFYPIRGTWVQQWGGRWVHVDINRGRDPHQGAHSETRIDYYAVPVTVEELP